MADNQTTHDWVVSVRLGDVDGMTADEWMEAIMEFVYTRGFSGAVVMRKEPVNITSDADHTSPPD